MKKKNTQINKSRNEQGEVTTDNTEIQEIVRIYYKQLYAHKMDNLDEMDKFLKACNLPKLNQEESEYLNTPITINKIEAVNNKFLTNKTPGPSGF